MVVQSADALKTAQLYARSKLAADVRTGRPCAAANAWLAGSYYMAWVSRERYDGHEGLRL